MFLPLRLIPVPVQCVVLATVLNLYLTRREDLAPLLDELEGRVFRVRVADANAVLFLGFTDGRPWVHPAHDAPADVKIEAAAAGFARLTFGGEDPDDLVFQRVLKLSGDSEAMLRFKRLFAALDLDWERELRAAFGDFFGSRVAAAAKALIAAEQRLERGTREALADGLRGMDVPDGERFQSWQAEVELVARRISRLKGRVTRLEHRLEAMEGRDAGGGAA
ncbi:MAG: SCP2 sterol-binding domain-containing protein [Mariprofundaceae bacterium]